MRYLIILIFLSTGLLFNYKRIYTYNNKQKINITVNNKDTPPTLSLTSIALGPLRGILINALWLRSIKQASLGEVYDSLQLIDWMTTLQPHNPKIWEYHGWNITYNIAYESRDPYYRWDWVYYGFTLLRDKALKYNPDNNFNRPIRQQMAIILFDRINKDDFGFHNLFKYQWAVKMLKYFDSDREAEIEAYYKAADTKAQLLTNSAFAKYHKQVLNKYKIDILDFNKRKPTIRPYKVTMDKNELINAHASLYFFYKKNLIQNELKLDLKKVLKINKKHGPFDWRLPQAQVIYWTYEDDYSRYYNINQNFDVIIRQTLLSVMREGTLKKLNNDKKTMIRGANLRVLKVLDNFFHEYLKDKNNQTVIQNTHRLHKEFLQEATTLLYMYNQTETAKDLFHHFKEDYPKEKTKTFEQFISESMKNTLANLEDRNTESIIRATLFEAYEFAELLEFDRANGYFNFAKLLHKEFQKRFIKLKQTARLLPSLKQLQAQAIKDFKKTRKLTNSQFNDFIEKIKSQKPIDTIEIH